MSELTPELRDVVTLLKMAAEHVLAGDALSADRDIASIHVAAATMVEVADVLTVAEQTIVRLTIERDGLQRVVDSQDWEKAAAENDALNADLAAARAALEPLAALPSSDGGYILAGDNVKQSFYVRTGDIRHARDVLSNPGTGEALAAVREAITVLDEEGIPGVAARLRAVFGEGEKR